MLVRLLGFLAESEFDTSTGGDGGALDGENFIIFEVNANRRTTSSTSC